MTVFTTSPVPVSNPVLQQPPLPGDPPPPQPPKPAPPVPIPVSPRHAYRPATGRLPGDTEVLYVVTPEEPPTERIYLLPDQVAWRPEPIPCDKHAAHRPPWGEPGRHRRLRLPLARLAPALLVVFGVVGAALLAGCTPPSDRGRVPDPGVRPVTVDITQPVKAPPPPACGAGRGRCAVIDQDQQRDAAEDAANLREMEEQDHCLPGAGGAPCTDVDAGGACVCCECCCTSLAMEYGPRDGLGLNEAQRAPIAGWKP